MEDEVVHIIMGAVAGLTMMVILVTIISQVMKNE